MKKTFALLLASFVSMAALASTPAPEVFPTLTQSVELKDGTTASVLWQVGKQMAYVSAAKVRADGVTELEPGSVFTGERLLKKADGQCFNERVRLINMETVSSGSVAIQMPHTASELMMSSCSALPGDGD